MKKNSLILVLFIVFASCNIQKDRNENNVGGKPVKNVILLIGDGMGVSQIYAAISVAKEPLNFEKFEHIGFQKTYSLSDYVTDSGASGTAIATGNKTKSLHIGCDSLGNHFKSILEIAEENGYATGLISTSSILHATPASFIAHNTNRFDNEGIALDFLKTDIDLFIGGGYKHFAQRSDSLNLIDSLKNNGYMVLNNLENFNSEQVGKYAVFTADEHNPRHLDGRGDMLPTATEKAIELLSKNENGSFLMVEGSQIDWAGHDNDIDYVVTETLDFDKAIGKALEFAMNDGNTLVIVTADHETGGLALIDGNIKEHKITAAFATGYHTGVMVPIFAYGPGAENFGGIYENTAIFNKMLKAYCFMK